MKNATINLATANPRAIVFNVPPKGDLSLQLLSADLSASTVFILQASMDETNWDTLQANDTDVTDTLVASAVMLKSFYVGPSLKQLRILFDGATTGTVAYIVNGI